MRKLFSLLLLLPSLASAQLITREQLKPLSNWVATMQVGTDVLSNLVGTVGRNVTNFVSLSTTNSASKPLTNSYANGILTFYGLEAGANVTLSPNASNIVIAATAGGSGTVTNEVLTNLVGTVANNVTNVVSLSTTNATSKPLTNAYASGVLTIFGLEQGSGHSITVNVSNIIIASDWAQVASTTNVVGVSNWVNSVSNYVTAATNSASVTGWINLRLFASANGTNWSNIPTGAMANVVSTDYLTNWANAISNLAQTKQTGSVVLTNIVGTVANNVTNFVSLSTTNATSKPLTNSYSNGVLTMFGIEAGANITVTPNASNLVIATSGGVGEANVNGEVSVTNATKIGLVNGKASITNLLRSLQGGNGIVLTNEGTNIPIAIDPSVVASQANLLAVSNTWPVLTNASQLLGNRIESDGTNFVEVVGTGRWLVDEEWIGNAASTSLGQIGLYQWTYLGTGTVPSPPNQTSVDSEPGLLTVKTTNSLSGAYYFMGQTTGRPPFYLTNAEYFCAMRWKVGATNHVLRTNTFRVGLANIPVSVSDPADGIWVMGSTNASNSIVCVTARGSARTYSYTSQNFDEATWYVSAFTIDRLQTNIVFYHGTNLASLVPIATNTANIPGGVQMGPWMACHSVLTNAPNAGDTNYFGYFKLWQRSYD